MMGKRWLKQSVSVSTPLLKDSVCVEKMCTPRENNGVFCSLKVSKDVVYLTVFLNSHNLQLRANKPAKSSGETSLTN